MKPNKQLGEHIKDVLENLEANYDPGTWDLLEQRMDDVMPGIDPLDKLVAGTLSGLEVPAQPASWDLMQQRIEAEDAADIIEAEAQIDNLAYDNLQRISVPFQAHHWSLLAQRLEKEYALRQKLYRYKAAELGLMVLLLLAIVRFLPFTDGLFNSVPADKQLEQFQIVPQSPGHLPETAVPEYRLAPGTPVAANVDGETPAGNTAATEAGLAALSSNIGAASEPEKGTFDKMAATDFSQLKTLGSRIPNVTSLNEQEPLIINTSGKNRKPDFLRNELSLTSGFLAAKEPITVEPQTVDALILNRANPIFERSNLRFSIFSTVDYNYVFTPSDRFSILDTLIYTDSDTTAASGYGGGILVNFKKGRWEVQTGGVYSFKRYVPNTPAFLFETVKYYIEENFHGIQQDILQVPLNLEYYFKNRGNWRIYGMGGASAHFITSSVYEINYRRTPTFNLGVPSAPGDESKSIRQEKDFPKGLLDGGNLGDNLYFTANVGFGVERFVTPRWSVFLQPNYQHYLMKRGIGTNKDKFYTLSFYLGTKVSLK